MPLKFRLLLIVFLTNLFSHHCSDIHVLELTKNRTTRYSIIISESATPIERQAASELQTYIKQISGAEIPIQSDTTATGKFEIIIGETNRQERAAADSLGDDGFTIKTFNDKLVIIGGKRKGALCGVYSFIETSLGCRKYSATVSLIPRNEEIKINPINDTQAPYFHYREIHYLEAMDRGYSEWHKLHSRADRLEDWGMWVHTFQRLVPAGTYFKTHPEYFSLLGGKRIPNGQLCLSNPDVFSILVKNLRDLIEKQPEAHYWSVSQNDNYNECQCEACQKLNQKFGGSSGTLVDFVNRVAAEFPDKTISTLAYQYSRSAPTGVTPKPNVNIMLCSIECNRSEAIATDSTSADFRRDIEAWAKLTDTILMWDYVVQFRNMVSPFPNLRVLQPNIRFFAKNRVRMMFQQGCGANIGEFGELRTYIIAKLLWNPDADVDAIMTDFLNGYYGAAGPYIRKYIDAMHDALEASHDNLNIYGYPYDGIDSYLRPELIAAYSELFDRAEAAVRDQPEFSERVKTARLPLEFAILDISLRDVNADLSYFDKSEKGWTVKPAMRQRLENFVRQAEKAGIRLLEENGTTPQHYLKSVQQLLRVSVQGNLAFGKPVTLNTRHSEKYPVGGGSALTNGLHGPNDYHYNWLGFEDEHLEAIIDLGQSHPIQRIQTTFLQQWYAWIWLPEFVEFSISEDGEHFDLVNQVKNTIPDTQPEAFTQQFQTEVSGKSARYIKVFASSRLKCPGWHIGVGGKAWIFIDEIVVE
ncbi:MAG: DUF4838 domain-containing protein [Candidatus Zhuqueibacterota bacterium]